MFKVIVPARIDLGGGITDIPEFASTAGTFITNLAVDLYYNYGKTDKVEIGLRFEKSQKTEILLNNQPTANCLTKAAVVLRKDLGTKVNLKINIENKLPQSTGLGISSALILALVAGFLKIKGQKKDINLVSKAYFLEHEILGVSGGFQDYIAAYFGNLNKIDFTEVNKISQKKSLGIKLNPEIGKDLNQNMIILISKKDNLNSSLIVNDEIINFKRSPQEFSEALSEIKDINKQIFEILTGANSKNLFQRLGRLINISWSIQKSLSQKIASDKSKRVENFFGPLCFGLRGPGCGANSFFLLVNPKYRDLVLKKLKLEKEFMVCFAKVNTLGLLVQT